MGSSKTEWHEYIWKLRPNHLAAILAVMAALPLFIPLGIPMEISYLTRDFYNSIEIKAAQAVAEGRRAVFAKGYLVYQVYPGRKDVAASYITHMMSHNIQLLFVILDTTGHIDVEDLMTRYKFTYKLPKSDVIYGGPYVYGVDWVMTPFIAGEEPAMARIASDVWEACQGKDFYGTSFDDLPMMQNIHSFRDVDLTQLDAYSGTHIEMFVRQWTSAAYPNIRAIATHAYEDLAYAYGKYIFGTLSGLRCSAEYQTLVNFPGEQRAQIESRNTQAVVMFAAIALGAIHLNIEKRRRAAPVRREEA